MNLEYLNNWNPWWSTKEVPKAFKGISRKINPEIFRTLKEREIIALTGIRRSGKTTIMYQMIDTLFKDHDKEQIFYVNLDDELISKEGLEEIYNTYRQNKNPDKKAFIFLDEIQNIEEWEKFLKKHYDLRNPVKFIISGSSASLLKGEYSKLLTGRNFTFTIFPLSFKEFLDFSQVKYEQLDTETKNKIINKLHEYFEYGSFPEVYFKEKELKKLLLRQYFDDIIYKDIVKRHNINAKKITDLAIYLMTNTTNIFTIRKIKNFTGLSADSITEYISYLEDSYLIITLTHFSYSLKETHQIPRKTYSSDSGIRNSVSFIFSQDIGRLAENSVCVELKRRNQEIYYWKEKGEVDFVVKNQDNSLTAINVSFTDKIDEREILSLKEFQNKNKKTQNLILLTYNTDRDRDGIKFIPLWKWMISSSKP